MEPREVARSLLFGPEDDIESTLDAFFKSCEDENGNLTIHAHSITADRIWINREGEA